MGGARDLDAGVVDEDVNAAESVDRALEHRDDVFLLGHVAANEHVAYSFLPDASEAGVYALFGLGCLLRGAQVVDRDVSPVSGETNGDRLADPRGAAGDQHVLAPQTAQRCDLRFGRGCGPWVSVTHLDHRLAHPPGSSSASKTRRAPRLSIRLSSTMRASAHGRPRAGGETQVAVVTG